MNPDYQLMLIAWAAVAAWVAFVIFTNRKIHPKALFALFMVELWERFSYYGMRALLILYMTASVIDGGFAFDDAKAYGIYGAYGALVYLTPLIGGYFADKLVGFRKAIVWGAILMALGQFTLFLSGNTNEISFYIGLAILVVGNGFFKPNISSMIGRFYEEGDKRRDGAFTLFYMGINMGAFLAPLTCGAIGENEGWQYGFLTAGVGMVIGYFVFVWAQKQGMYGEVGKGPDVELDKPVLPGVSNKALPFIASAVMIVLASTLIVYNDIVDLILLLLSALVIGYLLYEARKMETKAKQRIWVVVVLLFFTTTFWTFFELAGSSLSLFTARNVDRNLFGYEIKTTFFQSFNPLFIMLFAPIFSWVWIKLSNMNKEPAAPYKFGLGLVLLGLGFLALNLGGSSASAGMIPAIFMVLLYLLHTIGELTLSPVGLSLVTKLSPRHMVGFLMGIWLLSSSLAHQGGKHIAKLTTIDAKTIVESDAFKNNSKIDKDIKGLLLTKEFADKLKEESVSSVMTDSTFIAKLNTKSDKVYAKSSVYVKEAIEKANMYSGAAQKKMLKAAKVDFLSLKQKVILSDTISEKNLEAITKDTPGTAIVNAVRVESLNKGLSVFEMLGYIAIACGILLFLIGGPIKKWMHGIN
jgi:POT family proton-dependent oligopeptide transporter